MSNVYFKYIDAVYAVYWKWHFSDLSVCSLNSAHPSDIYNNMKCSANKSVISGSPREGVPRAGMRNVDQYEKKCLICI